MSRMNYALLCRQRSGSLLLEVLVGIAVFGLFVTAIGYTLLYGQENTIMAGDRTRAAAITNRALETARSIRDISFSSVTAGQHGVWMNPATNKWAFTGSQVITSGGYVTSLTVSQYASDWVQLSARTVWKHGYSRTGSVILAADLTDWGTTRTIGDWSSITLDGSAAPGGTLTFVDLALYSGSYIFAASRTGNGVYVFDTRTTSAPVQINGSFSLGVGAYDVEVLGDVLYVATDDPSQEIRAYDISSPSSFSSAQLLGSLNVQGSARARALEISGDMLYIGTTASTGIGEEEFYAVRITPSGGFTLLGSFSDNTSTFDMIALSGTAAYLASSTDTAELRVLNVESGANITLLGSYNLSDRTLDAVSIAISGTSALLGTMKGSSIQEAVLFTLQYEVVPDPPPGPWYHEGSGSIVGVAMDPTHCYGFLAAASGRKAFQVFNMHDKSSLTELATYNSTTGLGRSILYDYPRDRVFVGTDTALLIFRPGASTGTCP
jgi:hypothetical protein